MKKKDTSKLKITRAREIHDEFRNERIKNAYASTEYLFSITGNDTIERRNFLCEKEYLKDVPPYIYKGYSGVEEIWEKEHKKGDFEYSRRTETSQKFLCIGGQLDGVRAKQEDAKGYRDFNAASFNRGRRKDDKNRVILVHESLLG